MVPLVVDGEHTGYYAIYHDITELQAARQEADAANEAKGTFLASDEPRDPDADECDHRLVRAS